MFSTGSCWRSAVVRTQESARTVDVRVQVVKGSVITVPSPDVECIFKGLALETPSEGN